MHISSSFNILVVALVALVSFCTARTTVTIEKCSTRYCGYYVNKANIKTATKIVHTTGRYTITRWKTVSKPKVTKTATGTVSVASQRFSTVRTVTIESTIWIGTTTHTRKFTVTAPTFTETVSETTTTISPTHTIQTPSGFVPVSDDPDNKEAKKGLWRRNAEPEPKPEPKPDPVAAKKYATAVTCTKTLLTKTGTSDLWKTTTKTTGTTTKTLVWETITWWPDIKTVTAKNAPTKRITTSKYKVAFASSTITVYTPTIKYLTTVTTTLPTSTFYAACNSRNQGPPVWQQQDYAAEYNAKADPGETVYEVWSNGTAYDCCVACHTYNRGGQVCIGSLYNYIGIWGEPSCPDGWEGCVPWVPENSSQCELVITNKIEGKGVCRRHRYEYVSWWNQAPKIVSNGPDCARFKYRKRNEPL